MSRAILAASAAAALATTLATAPARAANPSASDDLGGYRAHRSYESPQMFAFELRLGPYKPRVDDAFELRLGPYKPRVDDAFTNATPYETTFGSGSHLAIGAELDWQALRIPYVGSIGPGFGITYTKSNANARLTLTGEPSAENTSLTIVPMYAAAVARIDVLARETDIPLVAYGKLGLGYALWSASNDLGASRWTDPTTGASVIGHGHTWGTHMAVGGMLLLDPLNPSSAIQLDQNMGVNNSYLFFEWMVSNLDGFGDGKSMRVGTSTWVTGLAFEL